MVGIVIIKKVWHVIIFVIIVFVVNIIRFAAIIVGILVSLWLPMGGVGRRSIRRMQ